MEHDHTLSSKYHLGLLFSYSARIEQLEQSWYSPQSKKYLLSGALQKKLADLCVRALLRTFLPPISFPVFGGRHLRLPSPVMAGWMNVAFLWARFHTRTKCSSWQTDIFLHQN